MERVIRALDVAASVAELAAAAACVVAAIAVVVSDWLPRPDTVAFVALLAGADTLVESCFRRRRMNANPTRGAR